MQGTKEISYILNSYYMPVTAARESEGTYRNDSTQMLQTFLPNQPQNTFNHVFHWYVEQLKSHRFGELCAQKLDCHLVCNFLCIYCIEFFVLSFN